jgi:glycosyltransferase involved in cell wall biosynthesis
MRDEPLTVMQLIRNLDIGGAQEVVRTLAAHLPAAGYRVVVCTFKDGPLRVEIERLGVPVEVLPNRRHSVVALPLFLLDMLRLWRALATVIRRHRVDVMQTHLLRVLDFLALTLRLGTRLRLVFWTVHNVGYTLRAEHLRRARWLLGPKRLAYRLLYRAGSRRVDGLIAVSEEVADAVAREIAPPPNKLTVIANGVDVARFALPGDRGHVRSALGLPQNARLIALVGTFKPQKGQRQLIEAAETVVPAFPDAHILLLGDGELRAELQARAATSPVAARIHFLGSRADVPELLAACDIFVLPSLWEGLPIALLEAMASGLPSVASAVSGARQVVVDGETGFLVPPGDVPALAAALAELLSDPERASAMGAAARQRVERAYSARRQAEEHAALYRRAHAGVLRRAEAPAQP